MSEAEKVQGQWYTLQVLSNQENKVRDTLNRQLQLEDSVPVYEFVSRPVKFLMSSRAAARRWIARFIPAMCLSGWISTGKMV